MKRGVVRGANGSVCGGAGWLGISCRGMEGFDGSIDETLPIQRYRRLCGWWLWAGGGQAMVSYRSL